MHPAVMYYSFNMNCQQNKVVHFHFSLLRLKVKQIAFRSLCVSKNIDQKNKLAFQFAFK